MPSRWLAGVLTAGHMAGMMVPRLRIALALSALVAGAGLFLAFATEWWGGLVPCALCLVERWPYRVAIALGVIGCALPRPSARLVLALVALTMLAGAGIAGVHVGVEEKWWPSPLPECAAPRFSAGTVAERLAKMPDAPSKPCDDPTYLVPGLPVSMAAMNLIGSLAFCAAIATFMVRTRRSGP